MATILTFTDIPNSGTKQAIIMANGDYEAILSTSYDCILSVQGSGLASIVVKLGGIERSLQSSDSTGVLDWLVFAGAKIVINISNMPVGGTKTIQYIKAKEVIN